MKRPAFLALLTLLLASTAAATIEGAWTASVDDDDRGHLDFSLVRGRQHQNGMTLPLAGLTGLTAAQVGAAAMTPVRFELQRETGTASFEGTFRGGKGAGQFTFTPAAGFIQTLRSLGVTADAGDHGEEETLLALTLFDVSSAFIRSMQAEGYRVELNDYLAMRIFEVTPELVRELRTLGYKGLDSDELVAARIHGVTPAFIRELDAAGYGGVPIEKLVAMKIHGITPEFVRKMNAGK